jgi:hypothetical protein
MCAISCMTMYSRSCGGFLANSVLRRILPVWGVHLPHPVFIPRTKNRATELIDARALLDELEN